MPTAATESTESAGNDDAVSTAGRKLPVTSTATGVLTYRSPLPFKSAVAEQWCERMSRSRHFLNVKVLPAKQPGYSHVYYVHADTDLQEQMFAAEHEKTMVRANQNGPAYVFTRTNTQADANCDVYLCQGKTDVYETSVPSDYCTQTGRDYCTCPDYEYRRKSAGLRCAHMVELSYRLLKARIEAQDAEEREALARLRKMARRHRIVRRKAEKAVRVRFRAAAR